MPWMPEAQGQPERDLLQLPALAEVRDGGVGFPAVRISVVEPAVLGGEKLTGGYEVCCASSAAISPESAPRHWWNLTVGVPHAANVPAAWLPASP